MRGVEELPILNGLEPLLALCLVCAALIAVAVVSTS